MAIDPHSTSRRSVIRALAAAPIIDIGDGYFQHLIGDARRLG